MTSGGSSTVARWALVSAVALTFGSGCSSPAPEVRPVGSPTPSLEQRQSATDAEIAALRSEVRELDGRLAEVSRERDDLRRRQVLLEERLDEIASTAAPVEPTPSAMAVATEPTPTPTRTPTPEPTPLAVPSRDLYQMGLSAYQKGAYQKAVLLFQEYLVNYRSTDLADNAQFWIGECYYSQGEYGRALGSYEAVIANYPRGNKVPAAMLKIAYTYDRLGQKEKAARGFRELMERHPKSPEARIARDTLGTSQ